MISISKPRRVNAFGAITGTYQAMTWMIQFLISACGQYFEQKSIY